MSWFVPWSFCVVQFFHIAEPFDIRELGADLEHFFQTTKSLTSAIYVGKRLVNHLKELMLFGVIERTDVSRACLIIFGVDLSPVVTSSFLPTTHLDHFSAQSVRQVWN
jgi:hypothetical protein